MDNVFIAVAGVGLIVLGVLGMALSALFAVLATFRFAVFPRVVPLVGRLWTEAGAWFAPPRHREVAVVPAERARR